jgi:hypothetical protein
MIPFTPLNICHKTDASQKRCFQFGYQVAIRVTKEEPLLEMKPWVKISFTGMDQRLLILAGDNIGITFGVPSELGTSPYSGVRMQPDIHSPDLP